MSLPNTQRRRLQSYYVPDSVLSVSVVRMSEGMQSDKSAHLTSFALNAAARCRPPDSPMPLSPIFSVVNVCHAG